MFELIKKLFRLLFAIVVSKRMYSVLSLVYSLVIEELAADGATIRPSKHAKNNKYTILILTSKAFRKDIECLVATNEFRVLRLPDHWQSRLIFQFYPGELQKYGLKDIYGRKNNPDHLDYRYSKEQKEIREFLYDFLARLYKRISIDCVISPHYKYVTDLDWGAISTKLGVPHILIPRDSQLASSPYFLNKMKHLFRGGLPKFEGKHIIIQSELDREVYVNTGYVSPEKISSLGCPRMDGFIRNLKEKRPFNKERRKKLVFLPFHCYMSGTFETDVLSYVKEVHLYFIQFAIRYPEVDVVVKPKPKGFHDWKKKILYEAIKGSNIDINRIPNLTVSGEIDVHSLLFESDVVCGLDTSVLLEASVIGLPVIIPYFKDLQCPKYNERVFYRDAYDLFDIAESVEELESLILKRLQNPIMDNDIMEGRKACFEKYVSSLNGDATEKYVALINKIVAEESKKIVEQ